VFHFDGEPIGSFRTAWRTAIKSAGLPGLRPHDLRRSAARNMVRAGVLGIFFATVERKPRQQAAPASHGCKHVGDANE